MRYRIVLVYVALKDPELYIERVRLRVSRGGHDIPDVDIRRRYARSLMRAPEALRFADEAVVLDNAGLYPVRMLLFENGVVIWRVEVLADWAGLLARFQECRN
jgi:predicted ABC-type ATPase